MSASADPEPVPTVPGAPGVAGVLALYGLARLGLVAVIAGLLLAAGTPLVIALLVGLIVALPLSMLLFRGMRARLDSALAVARARRGAQRDVLRAGLRGDPAPASSGPASSGPASSGPASSGPAGSGPAGPEPAGSGDRPERQPDGSGG